MVPDATKVRMTAGQRWVLALSSVAAFMIMLDALVVLTALDAIRRDLGASLGQLEWTVNSYTLSFAVLLMPAAAVGDRFGRRRVLAAGILLFTASSAACALAPDAGWLIAARVAQGAGAAVVMPLTLASLAAAFEPSARARALGLFASVTGLATLGGPIVGGAVVQAASWQWIFWLNVPVGVLMAPLVLLRMAEARRLDPVGMLLVCGGALGLVWGLARGNGAGWSSAEALVSLVGGSVLMIAFVLWELRARNPLLPMRFFTERGFAAGNAAAFALFGSMYGVVFFMAQFLQTAQHRGSLEAGLLLAPMTVTLFVLAPIVGGRINRVGERPLVVTGLLLQAAGCGWLAIIAVPDLSYPALIAPLVMVGAGASMAIPSIQSAVLGAVPTPAAGMASGTFNTIRQLGAAFGVAITAAVFAAEGGYGSARTFTNGLGPALAAASTMCAIGVVAAAAIPRRDRRRTHSSPAQDPHLRESGLDTGRTAKEPLG